MIRTLSVAMAALTMLAACAAPFSRAMRDPGPHHGEIFRQVVIYPYEHEESPGFYLACLRPCRDPEYQEFGHDWFVPLDREAYHGLRGLTPVRVNVFLDSACFHPDSICAHLFPLWLREVGPNGEIAGLD